MRTLRRGDRGSDVSTLQTALTRAGYEPGAIDGVFGSRTEAAVIAFQRVMGLNQDGVVGSKTWEYLTPFVNEPDANILRRGSVGPNVRMLQRALTASGHYTSSIDGLFGTRTQAAVRAFQRANGLPASGIVDAATWGALFKYIGDPDAGIILRPGDSGVFVFALQTALRNAGFNPGPLNGTYNESTRQAVIAFQRSRRLNPDGIAGPRTLSALAPFFNGIGGGGSSFTYIVQRGDTLWSIAQRFGVSLEALIAANPRPNPNLIFVGEKLTIPTMPRPRP